MITGDDFWAFSLSVYRQPGVPDECLALQNTLGADVNLLLLCAFLGAKHKALMDRDDIEAVVAASTAWHVDIVRNLRAARQALKPWEDGRDQNLQDSARALRSAVKKLELDAERIEHDLLANWANTQTFKSASPDVAIESNIRALLDHYQYGQNSALLPTRLIAAAISLAAQP